MTKSSVAKRLCLEGHRITRKIEDILADELYQITHNHRDLTPSPVVRTTFVKIKGGLIEFDICMDTRANGMGYGEGYSVREDGKEVIMGNPAYVKEHYDGRPKGKPEIGRSLWRASERVHNMLVKDGFDVYKEKYHNTYTKK